MHTSRCPQKPLLPAAPGKWLPIPSTAHHGRHLSIGNTGTCPQKASSTVFLGGCCLMVTTKFSSGVSFDSIVSASVYLRKFRVWTSNITFFLTKTMSRKNLHSRRTHRLCITFTHSSKRHICLRQRWFQAGQQLEQAMPCCLGLTQSSAPAGLSLLTLS